MLVAGAAAAAGLGGLLVWRNQPAEPVPPEAQTLVQKAQALMQDGEPTEREQAVAYLLEATRIAPDYSTAWGTLAFCYALRKFQAPLASRAGEEARSRSAARTALDLDADEARPRTSAALDVPYLFSMNKCDTHGQSRGVARLPI